MKKSISYGEDYQYAASRLNGTVIKHRKQNKVLLVHEVVSTKEVVVSDLLTKQQLWLPLEDIDPTPPDLGYFNEDSYAVYATRVPIRYYKQGINSQNVNGDKYINVTSIGFVNSILGLYPSPIKCLESVICDITESKAYSRNFCFCKKNEKEVGLLFRNRPVGFANWNDNLDINYHLYEEYSFLDGMLEESLNV